MNLFNQAFINNFNAGNTQRIFDDIIKQNAVQIVSWKSRAVNLAIENVLLKEMLQNFVVPNEPEVDEEFVPDEDEQDQVLDLSMEKMLRTNGPIPLPFDSSRASRVPDLSKEQMLQTNDPIPPPFDPSRASRVPDLSMEQMLRINDYIPPPFDPNHISQVSDLSMEQMLWTNDYIPPPFDPSHISHTNNHIPFQSSHIQHNTYANPFENNSVEMGTLLNILYGATGAPLIGTMEDGLQVNFNQQFSNTVYLP